jgi:hypothetical protein
MPVDWIFAIIGLVLALAGAGLLWWRHSVGKEVALMAGTPTSRAADVAALAPGTFVEVKGTLRVREPLAAEFSKKPAAWFNAEIQRTETYYERNSKGESERRTRTTTVYKNMKYGACLVQDESGRVGIDFDGATVEAEQTLSEPTTNPAATTTTGGVVAGVLNVLSSRSESFRRIEQALAPDIPIYVLGEVRQGGLVGKPAPGSKNKTFIISHKSEEERTKSLGWKRLWLLVGAIIFFVVAAVMLAVGIGKGKTTASLPPAAITQPA